MIICPECGEENPQNSKFCRKCGINLVYEEAKEEPKKETTAKKVTVENDYAPVNQTVHTSTTTTNKKDDDDKWCWGCCICMVVLFIIFAIAGH